MGRYLFIYFNCLFLFALSFTGYGQTDRRAVSPFLTVKGMVLDEKGMPLECATVFVSLSSSPSSVVKGAVTSSSGQFSIELPHRRDYLLTVRFLGYEDTIIPLKPDSTVADAGKISLKVLSHMLDALIVRPRLEVTADKIVYNFENDPNRQTSNLMDMIKNMPLILVDDFSGKIYVESEEKSYIVLRNGKPDALFNASAVEFDIMLEKLPAMGFTQFEIWRQPPGKYQQYDYVINILADKKQRLFGAVGASLFFYDLDSGSNIMQDFSGSADKVRFSGQLNYTDLRRPESKSDSWTKYYATDLNPEINIRQQSSSRSKGEVFGCNDFKASYDLSKRHFLNVDFGYNRREERNRTTLLSDSATAGGLVQSLRETENRQLGNAWKAGMTYQYDMIENSRTFNLSYLGTFNPSESNKSFVEDSERPGGGISERNPVDIDNNTHRLQADYSDNFSGSKFYLGLRAGYLLKKYGERSRFYDDIQDREITGLYTGMKQNLHRWDGSAELTWNPVRFISLRGGLSGDYLPDANKVELFNGLFSENIFQNGLLISQSLRMVYSFEMPGRRKDKNKEEDEGDDFFMPEYSSLSSFSLSYKHTNNRPDPKQLSNYTDLSNPDWIRRGNPGLSPESFHYFDANLSLGLRSGVKILPAFSYRFSDDKILSYSLAEIEAGRARRVQTYTNGKYRSIYAGISANYGIKASLRTSFSRTYTDRAGSKSTNSHLFFSGNYRQRFFSLLEIDTRFEYNKMFNNGSEGSSLNRPFILTFQLSPKRINIRGNYLSFHMTCYDVLNWKSQGSGMFVRRQDFESESFSNSRRLPLSFSVQYRFGKFVVKPVRNSRTKAEVKGFSNEE